MVLELLEAIGLRRGSLHTLRRTFFALGRESGASAEVLRGVSGDGRPGDRDASYATWCAEIARLEVQVERARRRTDPFPWQPPPPPQMMPMMMMAGH